MVMVTFPIGTMAGTGLNLQEATSLAERTSDLINQGQYFEAHHVVSGYRFDEATVMKVTEQLMTGFAMANPHRVNPQKVRDALVAMSSVVTYTPGLSEIKWGSSLVARERIVVDPQALRSIAEFIGDQAMIDLINRFEATSLRTMENQLALLEAMTSGDQETIAKLSAEARELSIQWNDEIRLVHEIATTKGYYR